MSAEFVDTNILVYAHDPDYGAQQRGSIQLLRRLGESNSGALSFQVLAEFYAVAMRRLRMESQEAEEIVAGFDFWRMHRPLHDDLIQAARLQRRYQLNWWDALILNSATELGCDTLWTEDFTHGQQYGPVTARNPFR